MVHLVVSSVAAAVPSLTAVRMQTWNSPTTGCNHGHFQMVWAIAPRCLTRCTYAGVISNGSNRSPSDFCLGSGTTCMSIALLCILSVSHNEVGGHGSNDGRMWAGTPMTCTNSYNDYKSIQTHSSKGVSGTWCLKAAPYKVLTVQHSDVALPYGDHIVCCDEVAP